MAFLIETLLLGLSNLALHKLRSLLTAMGIIFGVASVITMVAIGEGNKQKALQDIRELGARNIIVRSIKPPDPAQAGSGGMQRMVEYGITRLDVRRIEQTIGGLERIVPLKQVSSQASNGRHQSSAAIFGTTPELLEVTRLRMDRGRYLNAEDMSAADRNVAVIGAEVAARLFPLRDPLDGEIRIEQQVFRVVGILQPVGLAGGAGTARIGRDFNFDIHLPMPTAIARFGDIAVRRSQGSFEAIRVEITELFLQVALQDDVPVVAEKIKRVLDMTHAEAGDVTTIVPLELLEQAERTQRMFNTLMIAIASISLLVGGIGIMNIMLATVTERTREIGIRRALGATRRHIVWQFLVETTVLSGLGGLVGIAMGLGVTGLLALLRHRIPAMEQPQVTQWSVVASFIVAASVGIIFGLYPAFKAASQDPIVALRHD